MGFKNIWYFLTVWFFLMPSFVWGSGGFSPSMGAKNSAGFNKGKAIINGKASIPGCQSCHKKWSRSEVKDFLPNIDSVLTGSHVPALEHKYTDEERNAIKDYLKARYRVR